MANTTKFESIENFITNYKAARRADLRVEELAYILGIKPDTVARRKLSVKYNSGLNLPPLKRYGGDLKKSDAVTPSEERNEKFCQELEKLVNTKNKFELHEKKHKRKVYVITCAQNATPIFPEFLASIKTYMNERDAELMVIRSRYKNPTSIWSDLDKSEDWWHSDIAPYLIDKQIKLNNNIHVMGNIPIQPTAIRPLSGFESYTGLDSGIFGHTTVQLSSIPTPEKELPKLLATTGTITQPNYTDSKAGHKGEFHHSYAAAIVEIDGDRFYTRHIHADKNGGFHDLDRYYSTSGSRKVESIPALITGDSHAMFHDEDVEKATYTDKDSIMNTLNPENWVIHDVEDFYTRSHHHVGDDIIGYGKHHFKSRDNVEKGLQISADFIDSHSRPNMDNLIVRSNHDEAFDRWLKEGNPKTDPENAKFFHYMKYHQYDNVKETPTGYETIDAFEFWCKNPDECTGLRNLDKTIFLPRDVRHPKRVIKGIEIGYHGDKGSNGARGSATNLSKIGPKIVIGHSHTCAIFQGVYQVGVSARTDLEYASGPSSWMATHCIIYPDGSRTLIHIIKGHWKLNEYRKKV